MTRKFSPLNCFTRTKPLFSAVRDYLGVLPDHLHIPRKFQSKPEELEGEELLMAAARDSMYLLELANILKTGLDSAAKRATECIMKSSITQEASDIFSTFTAPSNIPEIFQN